MKAAFHFNASHEYFGGYYGRPINEAVFRAMLMMAHSEIDSKVFIGDLLLHNLAEECEHTQDGEIVRVDEGKLVKVVKAWLNAENAYWMRLRDDILERSLYDKIYVICLDSIKRSDAQYLHDALCESEWYLGAFEVDDESPVHWVVYSNSLIPRYRLTGKSIHLFWDGVSEDSKDEEELEWLKKVGFTPVEYESLSGRFTIFDKYHNYDQARRIANWKRVAGDSLAYVADSVIARLGDSAPQLGEKLWAAFRTFERAEVNEDYAQVMGSCRRIIEYVTDSLFPAIPEEKGGRKLGQQQYRNRLLAFADKARASETNLDLICVSTDVLAEQLEKLSTLMNKGVHTEVYRPETRRCLLRTLMILDDIASLKTGAFEIKGYLDNEKLLEMIRGKVDDEA